MNATTHTATAHPFTHQAPPPELVELWQTANRLGLRWWITEENDIGWIRLVIWNPKHETQALNIYAEQRPRSWKITRYLAQWHERRKLDDRHNLFRLLEVMSN